jgi:hypothetical protein
MLRTLLACLLALPSLMPAATGPQEARAEALLRKVDDLWRGDASHTVMSMRVKTAHYQRTLKLEGWSKGTEKTLVRILAPAKEKGTVTLKSGEAIYTYLPRTDRTIKLNSGMMGGSWMGSHFTNDDLVRESRMSADYRSSITFEGQRGGKAVLELTLIPRETAAVVWGKIVTELDAQSLIPVSSTYYDEDLKASRRMVFKDIKDFGGRLAPAVMHLDPLDYPGEWTELEYETLTLNPPLDDAFFSLSRLKRRGR